MKAQFITIQFLCGNENLTAITMIHCSIISSYLMIQHLPGLVFQNAFVAAERLTISLSKTLVQQRLSTRFAFEARVIGMPVELMEYYPLLFWSNHLLASVATLGIFLLVAFQANWIATTNVDVFVSRQLNITFVAAEMVEMPRCVLGLRKLFAEDQLIARLATIDVLCRCEMTPAEDLVLDREINQIGQTRLAGMAHETLNMPAFVYSRLFCYYANLSG